MTLDDRSLKRLAGVHPDLIKVINRAAEITTVPFVVTEGLRSVQRQQQLVAAGASKTMKSRHLDGHAVDLACTVNGKVRWDWPLYDNLAHIVKQASQDVGVPIEWGGDWTSFKDGPHYQLPWKDYP
jgi:peptidoglycan L-alanyl-D-glutamate endopeptidase CwlK